MKAATKRVLLSALKVLTIRLLLAPWLPLLAAWMVVGGICLIIALLIAGQSINNVA